MRPDRTQARILPSVAIALALASGSCVTRQAIEGRKAGDLDRKYTLHSFIEEGRLVTVIVNTRAARDRDGQAYMPLEVAIANNGLRQLTLTRESFTLIDENNNRYPLANPRELIEGYDLLDMDREIAELESIVQNKFSAHARFGSNFSPVNGYQGRLSLVRDMVSLPRFGYLIDHLYFPVPPGGIRDQRFELFVDAPQLEDPVFVKFEVR